jgi:Amt family ammonium transporter
MAMLVTHLSAAAGAFTWLCVEWVRFGKPSALGAVTGMVAGLGTITPASGFVGPAAAVLIGCTAGVACFFATLWLKRVMSVDDSLDVFPVHGVGGVLGTLAAGVFASSGLGIFSGQGLREGVSIASQLATQACGVVSVALYTAVVTWALLKLIGMITPLRVSIEEETEGLDVVLHNERGYDL